MLTFFTSVLITLVLVFAFKLINAPNKPPLLGIYQQKNKYYFVKFVLIYIILTARHWVTRIRRAYAVDVGKTCDGTKFVHQDDLVLEQKYNLGDFPYAVDAVYFNGISDDGSAIICGVARRPKQIYDAFMYIKIKGEELLLSPNLPDTRLRQVDGEIEEYKIQGIQITNFIPMRVWKLSYNGKMTGRNNTEKPANVSASLTWSALWAPFNFDYQMSPRAMADAMAREPWTFDYFKLLQKFHQTHYEQMGAIKGTVTVDGKEHILNMPCVRDHTSGKYRDWRNFHRYVLHFIFLENGDCMAVGIISQPIILSHLTVGYMCRKFDQAVLPVDSCDFQLYQHGENGTLPTDYGFNFSAGDEQYNVQVKLDDEEMFYIGSDREAKFYERWSSVEANGVKGRACIEWHYNNTVKIK